MITGTAIEKGAAPSGPEEGPTIELNKLEQASQTGERGFAAADIPQQQLEPYLPRLSHPERLLADPDRDGCAVSGKVDLSHIVTMQARQLFSAPWIMQPGDEPMPGIPAEGPIVRTKQGETYLNPRVLQDLRALRTNFHVTALYVIGMAEVCPLAEAFEKRYAYGSERLPPTWEAPAPEEPLPANWKELIDSEERRDRQLAPDWKGHGFVRSGSVYACDDYAPRSEFFRSDEELAQFLRAAREECGVTLITCFITNGVGLLSKAMREGIEHMEPYKGCHDHTQLERWEAIAAVAEQHNDFAFESAARREAGHTSPGTTTQRVVQLPSGDKDQLFVADYHPLDPKEGTWRALFVHETIFDKPVWVIHTAPDGTRREWCLQLSSDDPDTPVKDHKNVWANVVQFKRDEPAFRYQLERYFRFIERIGAPVVRADMAHLRGQAFWKLALEMAEARGLPLGEPGNWLIEGYKVGDYDPRPGFQQLGMRPYDIDLLHLLDERRYETVADIICNDLGLHEQWKGRTGLVRTHDDPKDKPNRPRRSNAEHLADYALMASLPFGSILTTMEAQRNLRFHVSAALEPTRRESRHFYAKSALLDPGAWRTARAIARTADAEVCRHPASTKEGVILSCGGGMEALRGVEHVARQHVHANGRIDRLVQIADPRAQERDHSKTGEPNGPMILDLARTFKLNAQQLSEHCLVSLSSGRIYPIGPDGTFVLRPEHDGGPLKSEVYFYALAGKREVEAELHRQEERRKTNPGRRPMVFPKNW